MPSMPNIVKGVAAIECNAAQKVSRQVFNKRSGKLKATKPYKKLNLAHPDAVLHASANYMWRILCFDMADHAPHNCMPVTADWDLRACFKRSKNPGLSAWLDTLDEAIGQIEATIPADQHHGAIRWGRALDLLNRAN